jgi:hypothetical protein
LHHQDIGPTIRDFRGSEIYLAEMPGSDIGGRGLSIGT